MADLLLALSSSLVFGTMSVLLVVLGGDDRQRILGLMAGGFVTALIATPFLHVHWTPQSVVVAYLSGLLLGWGLFDQTICLRVLGVSRTMPTSTGMQLVAMSLGGVLLFGEWRRGASPLYGGAAILALVLGVWLVSRHEARSAEDALDLDWGRGLRLLLTSTFGLVVYLLFVRWFGVDGQTALLPQALGYMTVALVLTSPRFTPWDGPADTRWSRTTLRQLLPGMMWGGAVLILQVSAGRVGVATGFTLSQLGILISTPAGILLLGEHRTKRELRWTAMGVALVILGAFLAGAAKAIDAA
ncbi:GRP family sugar transporter [Actinomyces culturomici]|uniref:GRP family sugar transporter n=1 Tax=Actinomyces culturomici TaxID=1926276 RepID=UPI000E1FE10C|nr:GRP family sugar transporter [Actinomyces culturomici]